MMVSTLTHLIYGVLIWKIFELQIPIWVAILLSELPDVDFLIGRVIGETRTHRRYFHNIFFYAAMVGISTYFFGFLVSILFISMHVILDLFDSDGVPLLYPFKNKNYRIHEIGHFGKVPEKIFWDGTWWFIIIAAIIYLLIVLVHSLP